MKLRHVWKTGLKSIFFAGLLAVFGTGAAAQTVKVDASFQVIGAGPKAQVRDTLMDAFTFYLRAEEANGATRVCGHFTGIEFLLNKKDWSKIIISVDGKGLATGSFLRQSVTHHHPTAVAMKSPLARRSHLGRRAKCAQTQVPWKTSYAQAPLRVTLPDEAYKTCNGRKSDCVLTIQ